MTDDLQILVVTKGHPFERDAFFAMFGGMDGIETTHVEQPAAQAFFAPQPARDWDAYLLYDMPGFDHSNPNRLATVEPPESYKNGFVELLEAGHGFVFLHHAIVGWPSWDEYGDIIGGRFFMQPTERHGKSYPDSGYRFDTSHHVSPASDHPILRGLAGGFDVEDELYLYVPYEEHLTPLMRSDFEYSEDNFYSG